MIRELHAQLRSGAVTATELVEQSLRAIEEKDGADGINAFLTVTADAARAHAAAVDAKLARGDEVDLLAGIPYGVKDAICTKGVRTTAASKMLDHYIPPYDATVMERLAATDAVMVGKTNMDEFAMGASTENSAYGRTKHPTVPERVPGGSSGGSAAAVAAGEVIWALGSDTGGSIRQPAAFCGCVGLKPTYGRVSRYGLIAMASSLDQIGPLTRTVEDAAIILSRIAGQDLRDATSAHSGGKPYEDYITGDIAGVTVGILPAAFYKDVDARIVERITVAAERLRARGAKIREISLPYLRYALSVYYIIMPSEVSSNMARFDGIRYGMTADDRADNAPGDGINERYQDTRRIFLGDEVKRRVMLGTYALSAGYYDQYYNKAQKVRRLIHRDFARVFKDVDVILMPTTPEVAFRAGAKTKDPLTMYLSDIFTVGVNLAGVPAISVPAGTVEDDGIALPVGAQLIGKWFDEEGLLNVADVLEKEMVTEA